MDTQMDAEVAVDPNLGVYRIKLGMTDIDNKAVFIDLYGSVCPDGVVCIWLYDAAGTPHAEVVHDVVELVVESKHLIDLHIREDFNDMMWTTYRTFLIDTVRSIENDGGIVKLNDKIMGEIK